MGIKITNNLAIIITINIIKITHNNLNIKDINIKKISGKNIIVNITNNIKNISFLFLSFYYICLT